VGLITGLLTLPLAPVRGVVALAEQIQHQAEQEFFDPVRIREQLADVQRRREQGELSDEEATVLEDELIERLVEASERRERAGP
jgi:chorismate mutase